MSGYGRRSPRRGRIRLSAAMTDASTESRVGDKAQTMGASSRYTAWAQRLRR